MEDFINKEYLQHCGDTLRVLEKTTQKSGAEYLWKCQFQKYPCEILALKGSILKGTILNPQIEQKEFIEKLWPQSCGDTLKIIRKTDNKQGASYLWECEFVKYPYKILARKSNICAGKILNPLIVENEFIGKIFEQKCKDSLLVTSEFKLNQYGAKLYRCEFQKFPFEVYALKSDIKRGYIENPALPWKSKENILKFISEKYFQTKPSLKQLSNDWGLCITSVGKAILKYNLKSYINYSISSQEQELKDFLLSIGIEADSIQLKNNTVKFFQEDFEIDLYLPKEKVGIEFNGNLWHSNDLKYGINDYLYHQKKSVAAKNLGIRVIHIFEYEWNNNQNLIKKFLKVQLTTNKKIGARKCIIKELNIKEYQDFCNQNHLQGECSAKVKLGLYYKEELVQVMSFCKPRFTDKYEWEIIRECSKYNIIGGKQKLWNFFVKKYLPENCISYCDFSKFLGDSYLKLGFKLERLNTPGFVWYDKDLNVTFSRNPTKNQELKDKYLKIYDCGQLVFTWNR